MSLCPPASDEDCGVPYSHLRHGLRQVGGDSCQPLAPTVHDAIAAGAHGRAGARGQAAELCMRSICLSCRDRSHGMSPSPSAGVGRINGTLGFQHRGPLTRAGELILLDLSHIEAAELCWGRTLCEEPDGGPLPEPLCQPGQVAVTEQMVGVQAAVGSQSSQCCGMAPAHRSQLPPFPQPPVAPPALADPALTTSAAWACG